MRRFVLCLLALAAALPASAGAKTVPFQGERVAVPAGWPVFRLAEHPRMCVRLDRKAVYLGRPSGAQRCPANAIGRRRAILVEPGARAGAAGTRERATASRVPSAQISAADFTGLGFDACTAPSKRSMAAWASSPYRAIGVYIGGINRGCSQPNLTASWVEEQTAAGWNLIPTYVGLQAPTSSCSSCATLSTTAATSQGFAAANDAVNQANVVGIGEGSPIYFDMESYSQTSSASAATLTFLEGWTTRLHALGYESGVYSSGASGIADLVDQLDEDYLQPDHIWIANWNGRQTADDPYVPDSAWSEHQRIRQYRGGHDETWGGVTINIDNNYVEGGTVGAASSGGSNPRGSFDSVSSPAPGQVQVSGWAFDPDAPASPVSIRAYLGGKIDEGGASRYELGPVASQERTDLSLLYPRAGAAHGFDASFPVIGSGRQRVCVYAIDIGPGKDKLLGCRAVGVPVPMTLLRSKAGGNAVRVTLRCEWPEGTQCPGQILVRANVRQRSVIRRRGRPVVRTRVVRKAIARRAFQLSGARSHAFRLPLGDDGRLLTGDGARPWAQLVVAIPGGRVTQPLRLK